jgi:hypothetical protein
MLKKLTGGPGKTSLRIGAGRFFTPIEGLTVAYPTGNPPYGLRYVSREPPQFAQPFVGALTGTQYPQQFPVNVPPYNVSPADPSMVNWSQYEPINGAISYFYKNRTPYAPLRPDGAETAASLELAWGPAAQPSALCFCARREAAVPCSNSAEARSRKTILQQNVSL